MHVHCRLLRGGGWVDAEGQRQLSGGTGGVVWSVSRECLQHHEVCQGELGSPCVQMQALTRAHATCQATPTLPVDLLQLLQVVVAPLTLPCFSTSSQAPFQLALPASPCLIRSLAVLPWLYCPGSGCFGQAWETTHVTGSVIDVMSRPRGSCSVAI